LLFDQFGDLALGLRIALAVLLFSLFQALKKPIDKLLFIILHNNDLPLAVVSTFESISAFRWRPRAEMFV